ncbi:hypothetical protein Bca4012_088937 [Brassica carinata]|uniref:(rape) hypothetical protein n=1 Tax=Brassica napus TaxID=3708 RepID=A0A816RN46_BRANA|nr:unnamed protein product [Brassica napus]
MCWSYHITKKPRETTQGRKLWMNDFSGARKSKDMLMPWKKLDANEFGIQRSSISESTRMVANKLRKRGIYYFFSSFDLGFWLDYVVC